MRPFPLSGPDISPDSPIVYIIVGIILVLGSIAFWSLMRDIRREQREQEESSDPP